MTIHPTVWILRACWLAMAFTAAEPISAAFDGRSTPVAATGAIGAWAIWGVVLVATLVMLPAALTVVRVLVPAAALAVAIATVMASRSDATSGAAPFSAWTWAASGIGLTLSLVAAACAMSGPLADSFVNGSSYGDERRFALRTPAAFLVGPIPVFWVLLIGTAGAAPLLLAAKSYVAGAIAAVAAIAVARVAIASFHALSRRWLVFVPAGVTLVDHLSVVDPVLFSAKHIAQIGPAIAGSSATDLTHNAAGLALSIALDAPVEITRRLSGKEGELQMVQAVLVTPGRPGSVMAEAIRRNLRT